MTDRLSQETLVRTYDAGHKGFSVVSITSHGNFGLKEQDIDAIIKSPEAKTLLQALPAQEIFRILKGRGLPDCLEILPLLSQEQFVRICDYDIWHDDRIIPKKLFYWLSFFKEVSQQEMYQRFVSLDQEYQIAALSPFIKVFDQEESERMTDEQKDALYRFPNNSLYYSILSLDPMIHNMIQCLLDCAMDQDMAYAFSILTHAAMLPPNEQEEQILQFRNARLEEDGFVPYAESLAIFLPIKEEESAKIFNEALLPNKPGEHLFLQSVFQAGQEKLWNDADAVNLQKSFLHLANSLCTATGIEPDDLSGLSRAFEHAQGLISLGLEKASGQDPLLAAQLLLEKYPKYFFRVGIGLVHSIRELFLSVLEKAQVPQFKKLKRLFQGQKFGATLTYIDRYFLPIFGFERTEGIKALFNRFPLVLEASCQKKNQVVFRPIASLGDIYCALEAINNISYSLQLAVLARSSEAERNVSHIDECIQQAILQVILDKPFLAVAPNQEELRQFVSMKPQDLQEKLQEIQTSILRSLPQNLLSGFTHDQFVLQMLARIKSHNMVDELRDLVERLSQVRTFGVDEVYALLCGASSAKEVEGKPAADASKSKSSDNLDRNIEI